MQERPLRVGWVGLGKMGRPMAARLVAAGYSVVAYRRRPETAALEGATAMEDDLARLAGASDILVSMISDDWALEAVADAVIPALARGSPYIDMSTVSPAASARVAGKAETHGIAYVRAPVVGSTGVAAAGDLLILASGPEEARRRAEPIFARLGRKTVYLGPGEEARHMKLALSLMVALGAATLGEGLLVAQGGGVDRGQALDVIADSALASPMMKAKIPGLKARDYTPMFSVRQMVKDIGLVLDTASDSGVALPHLALVRSFYDALLAAGDGDRDFIAYAQQLERLSGLT